MFRNASYKETFQTWFVPEGGNSFHVLRPRPANVTALDLKHETQQNMIRFRLISTVLVPHVSTGSPRVPSCDTGEVRQVNGQVRTLPPLWFPLVWFIFL